MKIFVINLARNPERLQRMANLLAAQDLEFERLDAVDGKALSQSEIERWSEKRQDGQFCLSPSEVGCMLSHRHAWEKIAALECGHAVILEDDIHFSTDAATFLRSDDWIPANAEIVKIETALWRTLIARKSASLDKGHRLAQLYGQHFGMAGYIISPQSACKLLQLDRLDRAVDQMLFDPAASFFHDLKILQINPALCVQDQFLKGSAVGLKTDIERGWKIAPSRKTLTQRIRREANRLKAQLASRVMGTLLSWLTGKKLTKIAFPGLKDPG